MIFLCFAQEAHHETLAWKHPDIGMHIQQPVATVIGHLTLMFALQCVHCQEEGRKDL